MSTLDTVRTAEGAVEGLQNALGVASVGLAAVEVAAEAAEEVSRTGRKLVKLLVVVIVLAGIAAAVHHAVHHFVGGGDSPSDGADG